MGTEIQNKMFSSGSYSRRDIRDSLGDNIWALHNEHKAFKTDLYSVSFLGRREISGYSGYEKEQLRKTILNHELIFKHQLEELHRLYKKQRDLMNEIKRRALYEPSNLPFAYQSFRRPPTLATYANNTQSTLSFMKDDALSAPVISNERVTLKECKYPEPKRAMFQQSLLNLELPYCVCMNGGRDMMIDINTHISSRNNFKSDLGSRRVDNVFDLNEPVQNENCMSCLSGKNKAETIIGVEIGRVDECSVVSPSNENINERKSTIFGVEISEENKNVIQKHVLPSNSKKIFGFSIVVPQSSPSIPSSVASGANDGDDRKCLDHIPTSNGLDLVIDNGLNNFISGLKLQIDLNLSTNKDEAPLIPPLPETIMRIASTEIDVEAPAIIESDTNPPPETYFAENIVQIPPRLSLEKSKHNEELDRAAAEAIVAISSSSESLSDFCDESLGWFVDLVCSYDDEENCDEESFFVSNGMDYFEFMTLNLKETNSKEYLDKSPMFPDTRKDEEKAEPLLSGRPRRGQGKRGKQRKDFQGGVLPGIATLTRHEVAEDMQSFEELIKATGFVWQPKASKRNSGKSGRGRRRLVRCDEVPTPVCQPFLSFSVVEEAGVTGWGKRMRRLPRRRCPINGRLASCSSL